MSEEMWMVGTAVKTTEEHIPQQVFCLSSKYCVNMACQAGQSQLLYLQYEKRVHFKNGQMEFVQ